MSKIISISMSDEEYKNFKVLNVSPTAFFRQALKRVNSGRALNEAIREEMYEKFKDYLKNRVEHKDSGAIAAMHWLEGWQKELQGIPISPADFYEYAMERLKHDKHR